MATLQSEPPKTALERVQDELRELSDKISKLSTYLDTQALESTYADTQILQSQEWAMQAYREILRKRLQFWPSE